jgi:6-phosphogluconolactonase
MQNGDEVTRREVLGGAAAISALGTTAWAASPAAVYAYVGSYTTAERNARGDGIHVYKMNPETGAWTHVQHVGDLVNPSFLAMRRDQRFLYSVHGDQTYATAYAVDRETGQLTVLGKAETGGTNGVHQAIAPDGRFMVVANYASGNVAVLPIRQDGSLAAAAQVAPLEGKPGPHRGEQDSSHPHNVVFDPWGRYVIVPDKGLDRVFVFHYDAQSGRLSPTAQGSVAARPGSAPRHAAFHLTLPVAWVVNELGSSVTTYHWDADRGELRPMQILPSIPPDYTGENTGSEIAVGHDGRFVYASNRGHDSVAIFAVDPAKGTLSSAGWMSSQGRSPRFIALDPSQRFLYAANEQSDTILTGRADVSTGRLTPTGQMIRNASPVTIAFAVWTA